MQEQLITFETAKLAKEKGFKQCYYPCYADDEEIHTVSYFQQFFEKERYYAPTQSLLQKWLREEHNFDIQIFCFNYLDNGKFYVFNIFQARELDDISVEYNTYEDALEDALFTALKIININL